MRNVNKFKKILQGKMVGNTMWVMLGKAAAMVLYMLTDIAAARYLGVGSYGEWAFFYSIMTMGYYICWFGENISTKVFLADSSDEDAPGEYFKAGFLLRLILSVIICLLFFSVGNIASGCLGHPVRYKNLPEMFRIGSGVVFANSLMEFFKECYIGERRYNLLFLATACEYAGYLVFSLLFLSMDPSPQSIVRGYLSAGMATSALNLFLNRKTIRKSVPWESMKGKMAEVFRYAVPLMVISIGGMLLVELDTFMLGILGTKEDVAAYNIGKQICAKLSHINYALWAGTLSTIALVTRDNVGEKMGLFCKVNALNNLIAVLVCVLTAILSPILIPLLYGEQYSRAVPLVYCLLPYYALYCVSSFYSTFLDFQKKARQRSLWYVSVIIIDILLNYILIPRFGMEGAAFATAASLIPYTVYSVAATKRYFRKLM